MKKVLSLVLVLAMVLGMMPVFAAGETGADQLYKYGFIAGSNGDLMVNKELTRAEMAVLVAEMNGLKEEAANYAAPANFGDVEAGKWYTPYVAYGQANGWWSGYPDGTFKPEIGMSGQEFAAVLMNALKYDFTWNTVVADAAAIGIDVKTSDFTRGAAFDAMWAAVNMPVKGEEVALGVKLGRLESAMTPVTGDLAIESIKAATAKTFVIKFNKAVTDADKITFAVKKLGSDVTVTTAWNEAKDEATLATASNLAEAVYEVSVLADAKEVSKESISITAQKVAKIEFTSDSVAVELQPAAGATEKSGYVTYKVYDQYENDITSSYLSNNLTFNSGAGDVVAKDGLATITPKVGGTELLQFQNISIVAYDSNSNVNTTVTLPTSSAIGTLKSITLGSVDGITLVEDDVTSVYYLPYTAIDMSGNETKNYRLVTGGIIGGKPGSDVDLQVSLSGQVSAKVVQDPNNSTLAAIEIKAIDDGSSNSMDMPLSITAMSYGGTSTVNTSLVKSKEVDTIVLMAPEETVAVGETPDIAFEAYDQFGNKVTKFADIVKAVSFTNIHISENTDGTARLQASKGDNGQDTLTKLSEGTIALAANVKNSPKMARLTLNVQKPAVPSKLVLNKDDIVSAMETGATQDITIDEGEAVTVYDQYDREIESDDLDTFLKTGGYTVAVNSTSNGAISVGTYAFNAAGNDETLTAGTAGSGTVTFTLLKGAKSLSTVSMSFAVVKTDDIVDYTISDVDKAIYTSMKNLADVKDSDTRYDATYEVYGKTNSGSKVLLADKDANGYDLVDSVSVSNTDDFYVASAGKGGYDYASINAIKPVDQTKTGAETTVTVNIFHNKKLISKTSTLKSSTVKPVASKITTTGATDEAFTISVADLTGAYLTDYTTAGASVAKSAKDTVTGDTLRFRITDQYGSRAMNFSSFKVVKSEGAGSSITDLTLSGNQVTAVAAAASGKSYWISASTSNGLVKTIKVTIR